MLKLLSYFTVVSLFVAYLPFSYASQNNNTPKFIPYADLTLNTHWDNTYQDMEPMDLAAVSATTGVTNYHLAFITDSGSCTPAWGGQASYPVSKAWGNRLTDNLRAKGINFFVSFGGASNNDISLACSDDALENAYENVIKAYQPQGLDFDIENGTADVGKVTKVLMHIQSRHPNLKISFTLPVMPEGLVAQGQDIVRKAKASNLNFTVNIMAMDYGPAYSNDMGQYAIQSANNVFSFLKTLYPEKSDTAIYQMIEVTPMIGVNDINVEQFTLGNVDTLRKFAEQNSLSALGMWSITRDFPCADKWATPTCSGNNLQTVPYEFSSRFLS